MASARRRSWRSKALKRLGPSYSFLGARTAPLPSPYVEGDPIVPIQAQIKQLDVRALWVHLQWPSTICCILCRSIVLFDLPCVIIALFVEGFRLQVGARALSCADHGFYQAFLQHSLQKQLFFNIRQSSSCLCGSPVKTSGVLVSPACWLRWSIFVSARSQDAYDERNRSSLLFPRLVNLSESALLFERISSYLLLVGTCVRLVY